MSVTVSSLIGPILAFFGTLIVVAAGFYQWRRTQGNPNRSAAADARGNAREALWNVLEEVNIHLRTAADDERKALPVLQRDVNTLFLRNSLYLSDDDQALVTDYVAAMDAVGTLMEKADDSPKQAWRNTSLGAPSGGELGAAHQRMKLLRATVKARLSASVDAG